MTEHKTYHSRGCTIKIDHTDDGNWWCTVVAPDGETIDSFVGTVLLNARVRAEQIIDDHIGEYEAPRLSRLLYRAADEVVDAVSAAFGETGETDDVDETDGPVDLDARRPDETDDVDETDPADETDLEGVQLVEFLENMTNDQLREWLSEHDLPTGGVKADLVERIVQHMLTHEE